MVHYGFIMYIRWWIKNPWFLQHQKFSHDKKKLSYNYVQKCGLYLIKSFWKHFMSFKTFKKKKWKHWYQCDKVCLCTLHSLDSIHIISHIFFIIYLKHCHIKTLKRLISASKLIDWPMLLVSTLINKRNDEFKKKKKKPEFDQIFYKKIWPSK
jgi:hypothetical protein